MLFGTVLMPHRKEKLMMFRVIKRLIDRMSNVTKLALIVIGLYLLMYVLIDLIDMIAM